MLESDDPEMIATRENMQQLVSDGHLIESELAEIVHRERSARDSDNKGAKSWLKTSTDIVMQSIRPSKPRQTDKGRAFIPTPIKAPSGRPHSAQIATSTAA